MAKRYTHLAPEERYYIKARLKAGDSRAEVARSLGRSASTVSRDRGGVLISIRAPAKTRTGWDRLIGSHAILLSLHIENTAPYGRLRFSRESRTEQGQRLICQLQGRSIPLTLVHGALLPVNAIR